MNLLSRRAFLAGATGTAAAAAATALAAGGAGGLLAGCDSTALNAGLLHEPLPPDPDHPVTWRISAGNRPIADGLLAERDATLHIYTWPGRIAAECLDKFRRKHGCLIKVTTFGSITEAITTITTRPTRFDVLLGMPVAMLGTLIRSNLVQPLNHSYIPNISQAWPMFTSPFYDQQWRYTAPYTVYTTGIGWRRDLTNADPYALVNGWQLLWQPNFGGHAAILDDYREGISLGLLHDGQTYLNTADPRLIDTAGQSLSELVSLVRPRLSNHAFADLAAGTTWAQHAWSGQVAAAAMKLPPGTPVNVLGYWFPASGQGPVANDTITIARSARSPVLAHLFANFMLDAPNALANTRGIGYVQPITSLTPTQLVRYGALPASLISTAVLQTDLIRGPKELQLQSAADALWQQAWQSVVTHMRLSPIG